MRNGLLAAGNWIVDHVKTIERWPAEDTLVSILHQSRSNGGSPYNILVDLANLGAPFRLEAAGRVGDDENGQGIIADCRSRNIDTTQLRRDRDTPTSFTDVMTVQSTGRRTFFHQRGANAFFDIEDVDFSRTSAKLFHLGYLLLLDRLDQVEGNSTRAAELLRRARAAGLRTSVDLVSEHSERFARVVLPALPHVDVLFANDFEAEKLTGIPLRKGNAIDSAAVDRAALALARHGVHAWVIIHFPEGAYACDPLGHGTWQSSLQVPSDKVVGANGAGDAFAAGVLYGLHEEHSISDCLHFGVCAAAACLSDSTTSRGVTSLTDCLALAPRYGYRPRG